MPSDEEIARIARESEESAKREPHAESVIYHADSGKIIVRLRGGSVVTADARSLSGLANATDEQLANVPIFDGRTLFFDAVDVQFSLIAFISDALGIPTIYEATRHAGSAKSAAKSAASRANGANGGRPRKAA